MYIFSNDQLPQTELQITFEVLLFCLRLSRAFLEVEKRKDFEKTSAKGNGVKAKLLECYTSIPIRAG